MPHLVKLFHDPDEVQNRAPILRLLADLVDAVRQSETVQASETATLAPYKDEVLGVLTVGLKHTSGSVHALDGLKSMASTPRLLSDEELGFIVHSVNDLLSGDVTEMSEDVRCPILLSLLYFVGPS